MNNYNHSTTHNYPNEHKTHHENSYSDITITDTDIHPDKDVDVTFHSAVGNSLVLNLTRDELAEFVDKATSYLNMGNNDNRPENYSYCLNADEICARANNLVHNDDAGIITLSDEFKRGLEDFIMLSDKVQKRIAAEALYQVVEIDDVELRALGNTAMNEATRRIVDYTSNHNV